MAEDWYVSPDCDAATYSTTEYQGEIPAGDCCVAQTTFLGTTSIAYYEPEVCDSVDSAYTMSIVAGFIQAVAGIAGTVGLIMFISKLLWIPFSWSVVGIVMDVIAWIMIGMSYSLDAVINIVIGASVAFLFWKNQKIMKETLGR
eukprot:CAMPEP_0197028970 /NCGR_PEP_ID=MMETSP1384-20130603/8531_1 /TAXON_ID=29189 /ORGANISM="Ammonia sp." /LENGTH=143 /DNA_ID=CAMNT_0042458055 /DNA_START=158 /DNA_END=589 /DNA_ORIENTATION=+